MFLLLLLLVLVGAAVHCVRSRERTPARAGELLVRYVLVGYCGLPMLAVAGGVLVAPAHTLGVFGVSAAGELEAFFGWAYLGMAVTAVMVVRYGGAYMIGPTIAWAVFFAGATRVHLQALGGSGGAGHGTALTIFATHGLVSVLLIGGLLASGLLRRPS